MNYIFSWIYLPSQRRDFKIYNPSIPRRDFGEEQFSIFPSRDMQFENVTHSIFLEISLGPENTPGNPIGAETQGRVVECHDPEDTFPVDVRGHQLLHLVDPVNFLLRRELGNLHGYVTGYYGRGVALQVELSHVVDRGNEKLGKGIFSNCRRGYGIGKWSQAQVIERANLEVIFRFR